ncbi:hypothetical protein [Pedobacter sp. R20-19]|uniref:hypothetical protein n=1 Tax=Pedobacter sp. R20-19 TaxID=1270196 RepID=UPI00068CEC71|nr:hypothetical protein [Pedobacter sp. R20-19]
MKIKNLFLALLLIGALASCKKDETAQTDSLALKEKTAVSPDSLTSFSLDSNGLRSNKLATTVPVGAVSGVVNFYRLFSPYEQKHFFALGQEANILLAQMTNAGGPFPMNNWVLEATACGLQQNATGSFTAPLYRYYRNTGDHYYSNSPNPPLYYVSEGIVGYMSPTFVPLSKPLYSYFKKRGDFDRLYTKDFNELGNGNSTWQYEGIIGYVL